MTCVAGIDNFADLGKSDYLLYNGPLWQKVCLLISNISEKNNIAQTYNNRPYAARKVIKICC